MLLEDLLDDLPLPGRMPRDQVTGRTYERTYARSDEFELGRTVYKALCRENCPPTEGRLRNLGYTFRAALPLSEDES